MRILAGPADEPSPSDVQVHCAWTEVEPTPLPSARRNHPWTFGVYEEWTRQDGTYYRALVFRNRDRSVFGVRELEGEYRPPAKALRKLAYQVICDAEFRKELLSDDPDLPRIWKRH